MTCADARDRFSDVVDERLSPAERHEFDTHLAGCAECRRDFERFTATVSLMRSTPPVHAPAGFVDRVLQHTSRRPWYRRVLANVFLPLPVKLPIEAAAIVLVAVGVVYLFQSTPELQQAARYETTPSPPPVAAPGPSSSTASVSREAPPAARQSPAQSALRSGEPASALSPTERSTETDATRSARDTAARGEQARAQSQRPASEERTDIAREANVRARAKESSAPARPEAQSSATLQQSAGVTDERAARSADELKQVAPPAPQSKGEAQAPARNATELSRREVAKSAPAEPSDAKRDRAPQVPFIASAPPPGAPPAPRSERAAGAMAPAAPRAAQLAPAVRSQAMITRAADVAGALGATDVVVARRALAELVQRHGAIEIAGGAGKDTSVVELLVPRATYPAFARDVASIGHWTVEREPATLPEQVVVSIRIAPRP